MNESMRLTNKVDIDVIPSSPFSFDGTFHKPSHFPTQDVLFEPNFYWQSIRFRNQLYGLKFKNNGDIESPVFQLSIYYSDMYPPVEDLIREVTNRYDLDCELNYFFQDCGDDPIFLPTMKRWRGMRVSTPYSFYEFLVVTTMLQNTVVRRSVQMLQNLFDTYGQRI
jgi:hypothetical protein